MEKIDCPALRVKTDTYPFGNKVPARIKMLATVEPSKSPMLRYTCIKAIKDEVYNCWTNSHGAVCVVFENGQKLGVKRHQFEVVEWHEGVIELKTDLNMDQADALRKLCKSLTFQKICKLTKSNVEASEIFDALSQVHRALL